MREVIAISANDGKLRIHAETSIPSAEAGAWDQARIGKLMWLIQEYVEAAELVDATEATWRLKAIYTVTSPSMLGVKR